MQTRDPIKEMQEARQREIDDALAWLKSRRNNKIKLERLVFFVPGWRGEQAWRTAYLRRYISMESWAAQILANKRLAHFITFTERESKECQSFLNLGEILKMKIRKALGKRKSFDLVGHSMGGLDGVAALTHPHDPLKGANFLITVATPHRGTELGEIGPKFRLFPRHHLLQCLNMDPDNIPIQLINRTKARRKLITNLNKLYCLEGTRDLAVMTSARFDVEGLPAKLKRKVEFVEPVGGARHSQKLGITQDPRTVSTILKILTGVPLQFPKRNYGYMFKKSA